MASKQPDSPNAAHPANQDSKRPLSKEEQLQLKDAQKAIESIKTNEKFLKAPKADREKFKQVEALLGGKK